MNNNVEISERVPKAFAKAFVKEPDLVFAWTDLRGLLHGIYLLNLIFAAMLFLIFLATQCA